MPVQDDTTSLQREATHDIVEPSRLNQKAGRIELSAKRRNGSLSIKAKGKSGFWVGTTVAFGLVVFLLIMLR